MASQKLRLKLNVFQKYAKSRGGICKSKVYSGLKSTLKFECSESHKWETKVKNIRYKNTWCTECAIEENRKKLKKRNRPVYKIEDMKVLAKERGGKCLSNKYTNMYIKLKWKCDKGHIWKASSQSVRYLEHWCPFCAGNLKYTLQKYQKIAKKKGGICLSRNYINNKTRLDYKCKNDHLFEQIPEVTSKGGWCPRCRINAEKLPQFQDIAKKRGAIFLSKEYVNNTTKLRYKCKNGHVFEQRPHYTLQGCWCPICANKLDRSKFNYSNKSKRRYIEDRLPIYQNIAKKRGGVCLSKKYINSSTKLRYKCKQGHIFEQNPSGTRNGQWCGICSMKRVGEKRKDSLKIFQKIAKSHGGVCLSKKYIGSKSKLMYKCKKGHKFEQVPSATKRGQWCARCVGIGKHTLEMYQKIAKSRRGKCLSKKYVGCQSKLRYQCKEGHKFAQLPSATKQGQWCPSCFLGGRQRSPFRKNNIS